MRFSIRKPVVMLGVACLVAGCQTTEQRTPWRLDGLFSSKAKSASQLQAKAGSPAAIAGGQQLTAAAISAQQSSSGMANVAGMSADASQASSAMVRSTVDNMRDALRIDPRVVPSADPTNLNFNPGPLQPNLYLSAAQLMESRGQLDEAQAQYQRLLQSDPNHRGALIGLARLEHRRGNIDAAIAGYQRALKLSGSDPVVLNDLGLCLARAGRSTAAIEALRAASAAKPDSLLYRNNLAAVLVEAKQVDQAVATLSETHGPAVAHYNVGYLLSQRGENETAHAHFSEALQFDPNFGPARTMLDRIAPQVGRRLTPPAASALHGQTTPANSPTAMTPIAAAQAELPIVAVAQRTVGHQLQMTGEVAPVQHIEELPTSRQVAPVTVSTPTAPQIRFPERTLRPRSDTPGLIAPSPANLD